MFDLSAQARYSAPGRLLVSLPAIGRGGVPWLTLSGVCLILSGGFAIFLGISGQFLPHEVHFLGMTPKDLCAVHACRIVHFMIHDRISFGGALVAIGLVYTWLALGALRRGEAWAWWLFLVSGLVGFGSFLAYLGYGYMDSWHGLATLALLPCFGLGLLAGHGEARKAGSLRQFHQQTRARWLSAHGMGRACLLGAAAGLALGGFTILLVGMTCVFVPEDLAYLGLDAADLHALNPRLVPLIAHDRAGFGGGVCCAGILIFTCVWCAPPSRSLWFALLLAGLAGFGTGIGVHPAVGYNNLVHLAPAVLGAVVYLAGLVLTFRPMVLAGGEQP